MKDYDLNIWYPENWTEETGTTYSMTLTVQAYLWVDNYPSEGPIIELTPEETENLRIQMPAWDYGDDWWYGLEGFLKDIAIPPRLEHFLKALPAV